MNYVILLAGGLGTRLASDTPKQYLKIGGKTLLQINIDKFSQISGLNIVIVANDELDLPYEIIKGGETRAHSVFNALRFISVYKPNRVLIHDVARPFVSVDLVRRMMDADLPALVPIVNSVDTLKICKDGRVSSTLDRNLVKNIQTPQVFDFNLIYNAYLSMQDFLHELTDDASVLEKYDKSVPIYALEGEESNFKITTRSDFLRAKLMYEAFEYRTGVGFDVHSFDKISGKRGVTLGGFLVPFEYGIEAHSDGDVIFHALTDAIFGTIGEGSIGVHFPPSDPKWKDCASDLFVKYAVDLLKKKNGELVNVDITVIAQVPRIMPYAKDILANIANATGLDISRINLKAVTTEQMGFLGRKEGIACIVNVCVKLHAVS